MAAAEQAKRTAEEEITNKLTAANKVSEEYQNQLKKLEEEQVVTQQTLAEVKEANKILRDEKTAKIENTKEDLKIKQEEEAVAEAAFNEQKIK